MSPRRHVPKTGPVRLWWPIENDENTLRDLIAEATRDVPDVLWEQRLAWDTDPTWDVRTGREIGLNNDDLYLVAEAPGSTWRDPRYRPPKATPAYDQLAADIAEHDTAARTKTARAAA